jgi:subtilisin-like proprotein convertase family protein
MSGTLRRPLLIAAMVTCGIALFAAPVASAKTKRVTRTATVTRCTLVGLTLPELQPPDNSITRIPFSLGKLPKGARILDVDATLRATAANTGDLRAVLASPGGAMADLINLRPTNGNGVDLGTGPACGGTPTTLDDEAITSIGVSPSPNPFAGSFKPESPLSALDGGPARGEFVFFAADLNQTSHPVTIDAVGAKVTYRYKAKRRSAKRSAATAKKRKFRTGTKDVCVPTAVALDNGNPPDDDLGYFLKSLPISSGKLPKGALVTDVDLRVRATHTYVGDLDFYLSAPGGGTAAVWVGYDESVDEMDKALAFGSGATDCTGALATFDDEAPQSSTTATTPFGAATFQPTSPLSALDGRRAGGTWTLWAEDKYFGDNGVLQAAGLHITYRYPARVKKK